MPNNKRKWISNTYGRISEYSDAKDVIETLTKAVKDSNWKDLFLRIQDIYGNPEILIIGKRSETDQEMQQRIEQEKEWKKSQAEREKAEYERLKAKYEQ